MTDTKVSDKIFENSAANQTPPPTQEDALSQAESALWKYFALDLCVGGGNLLQRKGLKRNTSLGQIQPG